MHITQVTATIKATALINSNRFTKIDLADKIGITRATLDSRLKSSKWRKGELSIIKDL